MKTEKKEKMKVIGVKTRTSNAPGQGEVTIPKLWQTYMEGDIRGLLPEGHSMEVYCVYCNYQGDHTEPYDVLIGHTVPETTPLPEGLDEFVISPSDYAVFKAEGDLTGKDIVDAWMKIWSTPLERTYHADFEVYGKEAMNPKDAKIDIFIGIQ